MTSLTGVNVIQVCCAIPGYGTDRSTIKNIMLTFLPRSTIKVSLAHADLCSLITPICQKPGTNPIRSNPVQISRHRLTLHSRFGRRLRHHRFLLQRHHHKVYDGPVGPPQVRDPPCRCGA